MVHPSLATLVFSPAAYSTVALNLDVITPTFEHGIFPYRNHVIVRLSLTGTVPSQFCGIVLGPVLPNEHQLVLWCYVKCSSCTSSASGYPQCSPIDFHLDPSQDEKHNQGFKLEPSSGTLTGFVTFNMPQRPRWPTVQGQARRCAAESLV
jgi:hypothetical protein